LAIVQVFTLLKKWPAAISWSSLASHEIRLPRPAIGALRVISRGDGYNIDRLSEWQPRGEVQGGEIPSTIS
jgi:hypothetical protein